MFDGVALGIRGRIKFVQELMLAGKNEEELSTILTPVG
jgi:hypothetical protein